MPAGSELPVELPVRFRPLGVRVMAVALALLLIVLCTVIWVQFPANVRASFTVFQRVTLAVMAAVLGGIGYALGRSRIDADESGVTVVNGYRRHRYDWNEVVAVTMRSGSPWAVLDLSDGTTQPAMGIQASDGNRARAQLRRLRALVDDHAGTEPSRGSAGDEPGSGE
jgi:hypothetical protein